MADDLDQALAGSRARREDDESDAAWTKATDGLASALAEKETGNSLWASDTEGAMARWHAGLSSLEGLIEGNMVDEQVQLTTFILFSLE